MASLSTAARITDAAICPVAADSQCDLGRPQAFPDRSGQVGAVSVRRCRHCGLAISDPPLADVGFLYENRASQDFQPTAIGLARSIKKIAFRREALRLLRQISDKPRSLLDFGCGSGLFTRCLGDALPGSRVVGSDFHHEPPSELSDRPYISNADLDKQSAGFHVIIAMHVIEHDDDPIGLIRRIADLGTPDGKLVFEVPNVDCVWAGIFGKAWDAWYLPFHRVHYSRASLRTIVERSGLKVEREIDACVPSMGRTLANLLGTDNNLALLAAGIALHPLQWIVERVTGRPSALRIIARKC